MSPKVISIIPARGGSVRVPKKNVKLINGLPLIGYAINASRNSRFISRTIVSTDSDEIKEVALKFEAEVPFRRPDDISEDVPTEDVVIHAVNWLKDNEGYTPDIVVCLEPPSPFRKSSHIDSCISAIIADEKIDSALTIDSVRGHRPEWMVRLKGDRIIPYIDYFKTQGEALLRFPASQIFEKLYQPNGVVFSCKTDTLFKYGSLVGTNCAGIEIDQKDTFDLDYPEDFELCELMMKLRE